MTDVPKNVIIGTAGHIDHGKSSLVAALTGTHPDRLEEEKRRGISIDVGFAFLDTGSLRLGFVDVPGHERFIANMLAGATAIDLLLLVISAGESVKPQTREHFDICRLLGIQRGVVALTKSDSVDSATAETTRLQVEEYLRGSFLESAPIVLVSAKTGAGLPELKTALQVAALSLSSKDGQRALFRLPIDRAFAIKGFGAVVTGTLISGSVAVGDEVELFPSRQRLRVRGVQSAGKQLERAMAGQRTAVNLAGIEHSALKRGMSLASPGQFTTTRRVDVSLELLLKCLPIKQRARVHFHSGTAQTIAEIVLHGQTDLTAGQSAFAQLRLQEEMLLLRGDRFIIRQFSPVVTIGGGQVLDPAVRRLMSRDVGRQAFLETLAFGTREEILAAMTARASHGLTQAEIIARTSWLEKDIHDVARNVGALGSVKMVSAAPVVLVSRASFDALRESMLKAVETFQQTSPLSPGISREELHATLGRRVLPETFRAALEELASEKKLELRGEIVKSPGAEISLRPDEALAKTQIEQAFASAGLTVPSTGEVLAGLPVDANHGEKLLHLLLREETLVRVSPELIFHHAALTHLKDQLSTYKKVHGPQLSVPAFKQLTGVSRKYAVPLLEYLDRQRLTRRLGDYRVIL
ncbi:MAG: selenocysteine-specific translation elongation factor [Candidatus Acidiferrum sp.]